MMIKKVTQFLEDQVFACFCLFALCLFVYRNMLSNAFLLDDMSWIVYWEQLRAEVSLSQLLEMPLFSEMEGIILLPLRNIFYSINVILFGLEPFGHHLFSLLAHCLATFLVYKISYKLTLQSTIAFLAACIFTLHPFQSSLVSFASGGVEILGACFVLLSFLLFMNVSKLQGTFNIKAYVASFVCFLMALGSHQAGVALPFLLLWFAFSFSRVEVLQNKARILWPFFIVSFLFMALKFAELNAFVAIDLLGNNVVLTFFVMIKALARYIILFCFPFVLSLNHTLSDGIFSFAPDDFDRIAVLSQSILDVSVILSFLCVGLVIYFICVLRKKHVLLSFCCGWFVLALIPFLYGGRGHIFFAQKYVYLASMGGALLLASLFNQLFCMPCKKGEVVFKKASFIFLCAMLAFYGFQVIHRNVLMRSEVKLLEADIKHVPESQLAQISLVEAYMGEGLYEVALSYLFQLKEARPDDPDIVYLIGCCYLRQRKDVLAIQFFNETVKIDSFYAEAYYSLAQIYKNWEEPKASVAALQKAYVAYSKKGDVGNVQEFFDEFFEIKKP